jgi:hypothetical protein
MEKVLNEKESLELIGQMISSARNNLQKGTGKIFLLWGYMVAFVALVNLVLLYALPLEVAHYSYYTWFIMPLGLIPYAVLLRRITAESGTRTYIDQVMGYVWIAFGVSVFTLVICMFLASIPSFQGDDGFFGFLKWVHWGFFIPVMLILYGFALFVSGKAYRTVSMVWGAAFCWIMTVVIFLLPGSESMMQYQLIALILSVTAGYIIPGHLLGNKEQRYVQGT